MKLARPVVALILGGSLVVTGVAEAKTKPKPVCNFIADPSGDAAPTTKDLIFPLDLDPAPVPPINAPAGFPNVAVGPNNDALDVMSADIASDKKNLTVVFRVKKLATTAPTGAPSGMRWKFFFTAEEIEFSMGAHADPTGALTYDAAYKTPGINTLYAGGVTGTFNPAKNEIHVTAPTSLFAGQATIKLGTKLSALSVLTGTELAVSDKTGKVSSGGTILRTYPTSTDSASSPKTYVGGSLSCVTPGK